MSTYEPQIRLPTLDNLQSTLPADLDVQKVASAWINSFSQFVSGGDIDGILSLFHPDAWWRDLFALTWDTRTFHGHDKIKKFLQDRLAFTEFSNVKLTDAQLDRPYPDLAWIVIQFDFETEIAGGKGIIRLVPTQDGTWQGYTIFTNLELLKGFPEKTGLNRNFLPNHGKWLDQRQREKEFADGDPEVLIVGGGQSGLDTSARLKNIGVSNLIIEKQDRIGDQWRNRYAALCLHDPVWFDHMPYIPFPETWPVYTPSQKLAGWLEAYAEALELNIWTSSVVTHAERDEANGKWVVTVKRGGGTERVFRVDHLVFCLGLGAGSPNIPNIPGREEFEGEVLHSTQHKTAKDHIGKKVFIVGACTSAHDIAADYAEHGVDVTIFQRSSTYIMTTKEGMPRVMKPLYWEGGPPTEVADRLSNSLPISFSKLLQQRVSREIHAADKELRDKLEAVGYKTNLSDEEAGFLYLSAKRAGGYYLDVGACQLIIDGKIKIKNDSQIDRFTKTGLKFKDGSEVQADVVLYATGFSDARDPLRAIVGEELGQKIPVIWGLTPEGEIKGVWRQLGLKNIWYMMGNLAGARFFSKHIALQIKAVQEGLYSTPYSEPIIWS
ncbi:FAD/NAD(P)-binding domain-containing protein [Abortiporus biennis]